MKNNAESGCRDLILKLDNKESGCRDLILEMDNAGSGYRDLVMEKDYTESGYRDFVMMMLISKEQVSRSREDDDRRNNGCVHYEEEVAHMLGTLPVPVWTFAELARPRDC